MKNTPKTVVAAMLALSLSAMPLMACGNQASQGGEAQPAATGQTQTAGMDVSSWKTLGDALAFDSGTSNSASWDEKHYVAVFSTNDGSVVRVVAKMNADTYEKYSQLDMSDADYQKKFLELMGGLELESATDLTPEMLSQAERDAYVGKTGKDLVDDGFKFESYWMYDGEQTGAQYGKGNLAYFVTFDATVSESDANSDETGASVMDAKIVSMEYSGASREAVDPSNL